jgi:hypothetical protein
MRPLRPSLAVQVAPCPTAAFADIQGDFVSELDWLEIALGIVQLLASETCRAFDVGYFIAPRSADLIDACWAG